MAPVSAARLLALSVLALAVACADAPEEELPWEDTCTDGKCDGAGGPVAPLAAPDLLVNDLAVLGELERAGFDLGTRLGGVSATNAQLAQSSPVYRQVATLVTADLRELAAADRAAGVGLAFAHRLFDARWLQSAAARFRLVAVVNRIDRLTATPGACGEVRLVYRLAYATREGSSRLPMTLMVVHEQPMLAGSCAGVARAWQGRTGTATALTGGPLANLGPAVRLELNLQAVRWPAAVRTDLGGHAEYLMRVLGIAGGTVTPLRLPSTIATTLTASQKTALATWITNNLAAIDAGTAEVPAEFLATKVVSVSPRGLARGANRPFLLAFPQPEVTFAGVNFAGRALVKSPGGPGPPARHHDLPGLPPEPRARGLPHPRPGRCRDRARQRDRGRHVAARPRGPAMAQGRPREHRRHRLRRVGAPVRRAQRGGPRDLRRALRPGRSELRGLDLRERLHLRGHQRRRGRHVRAGDRPERG